MVRARLTRVVPPVGMSTGSVLWSVITRFPLLTLSMSVRSSMLKYP